MTEAQLAKLAEYALGLLPEEEAEGMARELAASEEARNELRETLAALETLALDVPEVTPPAGLEARILQAVEAGPGRYEGYVRRLGALFDLAADSVREQLRALAAAPDGPGWHAGGVDGVWLYDFEGGPATAGADCGFVYMESGAAFPHHAHEGQEDALVLGGEAHTNDGDVWLPGLERSADSSHEHGFHVVGPEPFVFAVRLAGRLRRSSRT